ncbi:UNVERIFIED_CONTAM: protein Mpv17 [Sesamum calycinum]|uniref:Protein Mpv17 n=1 Tax=Sesamum calycinum TaxID=2727403 RepID=A0AAW2PPE4_9LAMI
MLAANPITRKSHLLFRWAALSRTSTTTSTTHISITSRISVCNPIHLNRSFANCGGRISPPSANGFKVFGRPEFGFEHSGLRSLRVSSGGGGGSGGKAGGGFGGSGGGGGNSAGGAGGSNWSLLSWYLSLSKLVTTPGASGAFLRLLLDQFLFAPTFIGIFLSTLVTLEGKPSNVIPKLQQEWFSSVLANWQLWIPFQFLNFRFVPQQFQVLAANFIALIWNVILSYKAHKEVLAK